jgi:hypothetical protein
MVLAETVIRQGSTNQLHVAILNNFMRKVFPDVNVLGALPAAYDIVSPFNACSIVFINWSRFLVLCMRMYRTSVAAVDAEFYSASAVDRAVVFCNLDRQRTGDSLYKHRLPDV